MDSETKRLKQNEFVPIKTARKTQLTQKNRITNTKTESQCQSTKKKIAHNHSSRYHVI